jgi:hypothetical protein
MRELLAAGGAKKALAWLVEGMTSASPEQLGGRPTGDEFTENLVKSGPDRGFVQTMANQAAAAGQLADDAAPDSLAGVRTSAAPTPSTRHWRLRPRYPRPGSRPPSWPTGRSKPSSRRGTPEVAPPR